MTKIFYALNRRFESLRTAFDTQLKTLDEQIKVLYERVDKIDDRLSIIVKWCETLRENQNTLQADLEKVYHVTKKDTQIIEKRLTVAETQKPV